MVLTGVHPTAATMTGQPGGRAAGAVTVEVVVPVHNEDRSLESSVRWLRSYLDESFPFSSLVTIADNASTDRTWEIAGALARTLPGVRAHRVAEKGRGRALREVWTASTAEIVAYMDVDLSTGLDALLPLVAPLLSGHSDVAIGSRLAPGSKVVRGPKRELISRSYNLIVRTVLRNRFSDAQCGFKALRHDAAAALLPLVADEEWFFDTELLVLAERNGLRIHEVPVDWVDDTDSRVHICQTAMDDLKGIARLAVDLARGGGRTEVTAPRRTTDQELARFAGVGLLSTVAYVALFLLLRPVLGTYPANAAALAVCTVATLALHWRFNYGRPGLSRSSGLLLGGALVLATSVGLTSAALLLASWLIPGSPLVQVAAVLGGSAMAALARFLILRAVVFRTYAHLGPRAHAATSAPRSRPPERDWI